MNDTWICNEWYLEWTCWSLGWTDRFRGGWQHDERTVCIGPLRLVWLR